jgi:hypothetical protein
MQITVGVICEERKRMISRDELKENSRRIALRNLGLEKYLGKTAGESPCVPPEYREARKEAEFYVKLMRSARITIFIARGVGFLSRKFSRRLSKGPCLTTKDTYAGMFRQLFGWNCFVRGILAVSRRCDSWERGL